MAENGKKEKSVSDNISLFQSLRVLQEGEGDEFSSAVQSKYFRPHYFNQARKTKISINWNRFDSIKFAKNWHVDARVTAARKGELMQSLKKKKKKKVHGNCWQIKRDKKHKNRIVDQIASILYSLFVVAFFSLFLSLAGIKEPSETCMKTTVLSSFMFATFILFAILIVSLWMTCTKLRYRSKDSGLYNAYINHKGQIDWAQRGHRLDREWIIPFHHITFKSNVFLSLGVQPFWIRNKANYIK